jgi:hypothetical protein
MYMYVCMYVCICMYGEEERKDLFFWMERERDFFFGWRERERVRERENNVWREEERV